ncbi:methyltransferase family protein [Algoriphagus aquaeductus]|uniref:Methyltransferase family protein n=1 Tax=Algoriphagus aquaeductus TaxID=475299 RepID=A0A326RJQ1_9BACT|nr:methyltransferase domain-containing protein [Algoriphagus aquaeductus]PZV76704.1 methyltransferase family protein [Algoriphagus aquaeductus]
MLRKILKKNRKLVSLYQRLFLPPKPAEAHEQWVRVVMDRETKILVGELYLENMKALEVSGNKWSGYGFKNYQSVHFPDFDICSTTIDGKFDIIIAEQVFEHLSYPFKAGKNVFRLLNDGGVFLITTPFLLKNHPDPIDCTRWTAQGLKYFLHECGFDLDKIQVHSWGNRACLIANLDNWIKYDPKKHSLQNEEDFPLVVWALAKK